MNIGQAADQLAQVFGMPTYSAAPQVAKDRILSDLNATLQQLQDAGEDFYGRADLTVPLVDGQQVYQLPTQVQTVLDPVRLSNGNILTKITTRGGLFRFGNIFLDQLSSSVASGIPTHYFVETKLGTSTPGEDVEVDFYVLPTPTLSMMTGGTSVLLQVINEPVIFTASDISAGTALIPVPHKYVESIFLPIARYNAMGSSLFYDRDKVKHIEDDYIRALQLLSKADPRRPKPGDSVADALEVRMKQPAQQGGGGP